MGLPSAEECWIVGIVGRMASWKVVEWVLVSVGGQEVASAAAEAAGFLGCTLRNIGDGRAEEDCSERVDYRCFVVDLEGNLPVPEYTGIGASQTASPDGSCIAGSPVTHEPGVGSAAGVKEYNCAHVDAEVAPEDKDRLGPGRETVPVRPKCAGCIWFRKSRCRDFFYRCFRHFGR